MFNKIPDKSLKPCWIKGSDCEKIRILNIKEYIAE